MKQESKEPLPLSKFILGFNAPDDDFLTEYKTKEEALYQSEEWCEVEAATLEEAKSKYEETFLQWQKKSEQPVREPLGITPGWEYSPHYREYAEGSIFDKRCDRMIGNVTPPAATSQKKLNKDMEKVCAAVNGTYGKGYNPLQVDALYKALAGMLQQFPQRGVVLNKQEQKSIDAAEQALKNAKL
jgi:hypothetical protein